jgi:5-methylcytosine-specific restriction protein B
MYLLEYRDKEIPLAAGGTFKIPENVYLIGTMNTADRSIALVDHALRRRFSFIRLQPEYIVLANYLKQNNLPAASLISVLQQINRAINDQNYEVGISFFMSDQAQLKQWLPEIWKTEIEPYLEEYFYDQKSIVESFRWNKLAENNLKEWTT